MNNTEMGAVAAALTGMAIFALSKKLRKDDFPKPKLALLVFPDGGEKYSATGGLQQNAITIRYRDGLERLIFLKNIVRDYSTT